MANRIVEIVAKYVSRFPLVQGVPDHDFKAFINDFLDEFMADVEQLTDDDIDNTKIPKIKADNVKFDLSIVTNVLKQSLSEYLNGNPTKSSGAFSLFFDKRHKRFEGLLNIIEIPEKKNFFRIRYMDPITISINENFFMFLLKSVGELIHKDLVCLDSLPCILVRQFMFVGKS